MPNHTLQLLIPKTVGERLQAAQDGEGPDLKNRRAVVTFLQLVAGDARTEMVDMVETDIAGEPLQHLWQLVEGTALQPG